ncbi:MAG: hypothetical protein J7M25_17860 [Deltaproteobacteria bacterium]|nr:hypothetical protein [Deltaproteobacteria bacterium]
MKRIRSMAVAPLGLMLIFVLVFYGGQSLAQDAGYDADLPDGGIAQDGGDDDASGTGALDYPDEVRSPVHFEYSDELLDICGQDVDTGWIPDGSPIQVRFKFHLGCGHFVEMDGYAVLGWPPRPGPNLHFRGLPRGGHYQLDYSVKLSAKVRVDLEINGNRIQQEFDLPWIPDFNIGVFADKRFDPFLLEGNPERPLVVEDQIPHTRLFRYDLLDILAPSISDLASAWLEVYIDGYVGSRFEGRRIVVAVGEQNTEFPIPDLVFTKENQQERLPVSPEEVTGSLRTAVYEAAVHHYAGISFYPHIKIELLNQTLFEMDLFEIPIPLDDTEDYWVFDPATFGFSLPDIAAPNKVFIQPTNLGNQSMSQVQIVNNGGQVLRGEGLVDPPFYVPYPNRFEIQPGESVLLPVFFAPTTIGPIRKYLSLYSNDPDESPLVVAIESYGCSSDGDCAIPDDMKRVCTVSDSGCGCHAQNTPASILWFVFIAGFILIRRWRPKR